MTSTYKTRQLEKQRIRLGDEGGGHSSSADQSAAPSGNAAPPLISSHKGSASRYRKGCRCKNCSKAMRDYNADYRARKDKPKKVDLCPNCKKELPHKGCCIPLSERRELATPWMFR